MLGSMSEHITYSNLTGNGCGLDVFVRTKLLPIGLGVELHRRSGLAGWFLSRSNVAPMADSTRDRPS